MSVAFSRRVFSHPVGGFAVALVSWICLASLPTTRLGAQPEPVPIAPAVADTIIQIESVQNGTLTLKNTGKRPISAVAVQNTIPNSPNYSDLVISNLMFGATLAPGAEMPLYVSGELVTERLAEQIRLVAVVFADGTHIGHAAYRAAGGEDIVTQMFKQRQAVASECSYWADIVVRLPSDDKAAIQHFLEKVDAMPVSAPPQVPHRATLSVANNILIDGAVDAVRTGVRADAEHIREALQDHAHDETWIRHNILGRYIQNATSAKSITTDKGEAAQ